MATCGTCQREIIWAWSERDHSMIAVDKLAAVGGLTYTLDFAADRKPEATNVQRPDVYPGHRLHSETCGKGTTL